MNGDRSKNNFHFLIILKATILNNYLSIKILPVALMHLPSLLYTAHLFAFGFINIVELI